MKNVSFVLLIAWCWCLWLFLYLQTSTTTTPAADASRYIKRFAHLRNLVRLQKPGWKHRSPKWFLMAPVSFQSQKAPTSRLHSQKIKSSCNTLTSKSGRPGAPLEEKWVDCWENIGKAWSLRGRCMWDPCVIWPKSKFTIEQTPVCFDVPTSSLCQCIAYVKGSQNISERSSPLAVKERYKKPA